LRGKLCHPSACAPIAREENRVKPFQLPLWRKRFNAEKFNRAEFIILQATARMDDVFRHATEEVINHAMATGEYREPRLPHLGEAMEGFYRATITEGWNLARREKHLQQGRTRMAGLPRGRVPALKDLVALFTDRRFWPTVMKRSKALEDRLRRVYLRKLRARFTKIVPQMLRGEVGPAEVHGKLMEAWTASKPRVATIFRTESTKYFTETQKAFFKDDPDIIGFLFDSVRDAARTDICRSRHGLVYRPGTKELDQNTAPLHYNCRSHLIALTDIEYNRKMLADPSRDPAKVTVAPLPKGWQSGK
jgi:SPP1 gp7 family putative phage head morphogenesis protein